MLMKKKRLKKCKRFSLPTSPAPFNRSEHMKQLHAQGRYVGTSKIGQWNQSAEKRERMAGLLAKNALDKNSRGYGSEWHQRMNNRTLLHNKFQGEEGYLYFLKFPGSVKVGFSKNWERRVTKQILGGTVVLIISGPTNDLADLEFDTFVKFQAFTQLSPDKTRYTEFLDKRCSKDVYKYLLEAVKSNPNLQLQIDNRNP